MVRNPLVGTCSVDGCGKPVKARGWCAAHYQRWVRYRDSSTDSQRHAVVAKCSVEKCEKRSESRGFCAAHYKAWRRHGDPTIKKNNSIRRPCSAEGCLRLTTRTYCNAHETRLRRYGDANFKPPKVSDGQCEVEGCNRRAYVGNLCRAHHARSRRSKDTGIADLPVMLTESQLLFIRQSRGLIRREDLATQLGIDVHTVIAVQAGRNWGRVRAIAKN